MMPQSFFPLELVPVRGPSPILGDEDEGSTTTEVVSNHSDSATPVQSEGEDSLPERTAPADDRRGEEDQDGDKHGTDGDKELANPDEQIWDPEALVPENMGMGLTLSPAAFQGNWESINETAKHIASQWVFFPSSREIYSREIMLVDEGLVLSFDYVGRGRRDREGAEVGPGLNMLD